MHPGASVYAPPRGRHPAQNGARRCKTSGEAAHVHTLICTGMQANHLHRVQKTVTQMPESKTASVVPPSDPIDGLDVPRADLANALKIVAGVMGKRVSGASLRFEDGWLYIEAGNAVAKAPARGVWPLTIIVGASWVRRLAKSLPAGDPVRLHLRDGRLYANRYSEPCVWTSIETPLKPEVPEIDEKRLILEAARVLKPLRIRREDLESLVGEARARGPASWRAEEKKMIAQVSKAWSMLAPLGVETADISRLLDNAIRHAWRTAK